MSSQDTSRQLSLVTVVFSEDLELLTYQARSLAKFGDIADIAEILIIVNDVNETVVRKAVEDLRPEYGALAGKVTVIGGDDVLLNIPRSRRRTVFEFLYVENRSRLPFLASRGWRGGNGYRMQQALKLASARAVQTDRIMILDPKNIFLRRLDPDEFFDDRNRALAVYHEPEPDYHRNWLRESLQVLDVSVAPESIMQTTGYETPYPVNRQLMLRVLDEITRKFGSVQALFASRHRPSEFMLLYASCLKNEGNVDTWYGRYDGKHPGIWKEFPTDQVNGILDEVEKDPPLTLGLHRKVLAVMTTEQKERVIALYKTRDLDVEPLFH